MTTVAFYCCLMHKLSSTSYIYSRRSIILSAVHSTKLNWTDLAGTRRPSYTKRLLVKRTVQRQRYDLLRTDWPPTLQRTGSLSSEHVYQYTNELLTVPLQATNEWSVRRLSGLELGRQL